MTLDVVTIAQVRAYPPRMSAFTRTFWNALREGRWITTRCRKCGHQTFPPKVLCPHCWSRDMEWDDLSTRGTLYSWTRIHAAPTAFAPEAPYAVGIVDLDSNLRLACRLVEIDAIPLRIGQAVEMLLLQYEDGPLFAARPLAPEAT